MAVAVASGGAAFTVRYRLVSVANFEPSKARMQSADVRLTSATMAPDKWATFELATADVRKLSSAPSFASVTVALTDEPDGTRTLAVSEPASTASGSGSVTGAFRAGGREWMTSRSIDQDPTRWPGSQAVPRRRVENGLRRQLAEQVGFGPSVHRGFICLIRLTVPSTVPEL